MLIKQNRKRLKVIHNKQNQQFEVLHYDHKGVLVYRIHEGQLVLMHTKVPEAIGGKGIAKALVLTALKFGEKQGLNFKIYCPYVKRFIEKNPDWRDI